MTINLDELRKRAELPSALHGCTSNPCGSVVCQTARDRDELLSRLEQAEQDRVKLRNRLDAMRRQRDGYRNQLRKAEQQIQRVREKHSERVLKYPGGAEEHYCAYDQNSAWPCDTIRALDGEPNE